MAPVDEQEAARKEQLEQQDDQNVEAVDEQQHEFDAKHVDGGNATPAVAQSVAQITMDEGGDTEKEESSEDEKESNESLIQV